MCKGRFYSPTNSRMQTVLTDLTSNPSHLFLTSWVTLSKLIIVKEVLFSLLSKEC